MTIGEIVDARKNRFDEEGAWNLIRQAKSVVTARGKKISTWNPGTDGRENILKHAMGPSGNLRAPAFRVGDRLVIGFNADLYREWLESS